MTDMSEAIQIAGGAGPQETAAILAVVAHLAEEEARAQATPAQRPRQSAWVLAWRPRHSTTPLPSHTYDAMPWAEVDSAEDGTS